MAPIIPFGEIVLDGEPKLGGDDNHDGDVLFLEEGEPTSFQEARTCDTKSKWEASMHREYQSLMANETWKLEKAPPGQHIVDNMWVYKIKDGILEGAEKIFKSRLVAKGYTQVRGVDFNEVFSPIAKHVSIQLLCTLVVLFDLELDQMDVVIAFLYGKLEEVIYMRQPKGYVVKGLEHWMCRLLKSIYGLKQAPRQWYKRFDEFMIAQGFKRSMYDPCVYKKRVSNSVFGWIILVLYVDDMLIAARDKAEVAKLKEQLSSVFHMKDLGYAKKILGMKITRDKVAKRLWLTQDRYAEKVFALFNMSNCSSVSTPLAPHFKLSAAQSPITIVEKGLMAKVPYQSAIGSLMYLMVSTRPDLAYAMSKVSRYMSNPGKEHWEAVKWMLRYLKGTQDIGLLFDAKVEDAKILTGYVDADHAQDLDKRKSTTGFVFIVGDGCISWRSIL